MYFLLTFIKLEICLLRKFSVPLFNFYLICFPECFNSHGCQVPRLSPESNYQFPINFSHLFLLIYIK